MHVEHFDPERFSSRRQLFDDDLCRDPMVAFHGTSSLSEARIEKVGLCWSADAMAWDDVRDIVAVFDAMEWSGRHCGGFPVLKGFTLADGVKYPECKPVFLAETSQRAAVYAQREWAGGEVARAARHALDDLQAYVDGDDAVRQSREDEVVNELLSQGRAASPAPVDITSLALKVESFASLRERLRALLEAHCYGIVYAVRFENEDLPSLHAEQGHTLAVAHVPNERLVAKVILPPDIKVDQRQDEWQMLRLSNGLVSRVRAQRISPY